MPCEQCRRELVERIQERRRQLKVKGLCIYCGMRPPATDHWGCRPCLDVKRAKRKPNKVGYKHRRRVLIGEKRPEARLSLR